MTHSSIFLFRVALAPFYNTYAYKLLFRIFICKIYMLLTFRQTNIRKQIIFCSSASNGCLENERITESSSISNVRYVSSWLAVFLFNYVLFNNFLQFFFFFFPCFFFFLIFSFFINTVRNTINDVKTRIPSWSRRESV